MDVESYDTLFLRTKESLQHEVGGKSFIAAHFSSTLEECDTCVSHGLELVSELLESTSVEVNKLCGYLEDAITVLKMLSDLIKNIIESAPMSCCNMKHFPTKTGNIILTVFMHCKDSECIYGNHLKLVETQLKDLFRTCHELQLTYLLTLKNFIFDLTETEEQEILIEVMNINMRIGDIVQALDVKTMAEQWKAYTVICEKYSNFLLDKNIYNKCIQIFASIITENIKTAMELEQDNKNILRSLKVANFAIKILLRLSNVFRHATLNDYDRVAELLKYVYMHNPAYLELLADKSQQFINLVLANILSPTDSLCDTLLQDERFFDCIYNINIRVLETNALLGYIFLIVSLMKIMLQRKEDDQLLNVSKCKLVDCIYRILPTGHYWFNMGLKFHSKDLAGRIKYFSLYEHLLVHAVAFASTLNSEQYAMLEKYMYEAILSTECYSALFSSNLWVLLVRNKDQLALVTLQSLMRIHQKLEKHTSFQYSPQEVHLKYTIGKLFEVLLPESKTLISKQLSPQNSLWCAVKVRHLPDHLRRNIEAVVLHNMKTCYEECFESSDVNEEAMNNMIQIMKMASTCSFMENPVAIERYLLKLWSKACHKNEYIESDLFTTIDTLWHFKYLEALVSLTKRTGVRFSSSANVGVILHNMSTTMDSCNTEITVLLFDLFCSLTFSRKEDENQRVIDSIFKDTLKLLLQGVDTTVRSYLLNILPKYRDHEQFHEVTSAMVHKGDVGNEWKLNCDVRDKCNSIEWQQQLTKSGHNEFTHKCMRITSDIGRKTDKFQSIKSEFDLGDFMNDLDEPPTKKTKLSCNEVATIIDSLENYTSLLSQVEGSLSDNCKKRITNVINELRNIVS